MDQAVPERRVIDAGQGYVPELPFGSGLLLSVEMDVGAGNGARTVDALEDIGSLDIRRAQKVDHDRRIEKRGIAQRHAGDRPDMLFELRGAARLDRIVAGIMDARSDLVDQDAALPIDKHFDPEDPGAL